MAIPALRALKHWFPESSLTLAVKNHLQDIFRHIDGIDALTPLSDGDHFRTMRCDARQLRSFGFDVGILFTNSFRSALLFKMARVGELVGYSTDCRGILLGQRVPVPGNGRHHRFFYLDLISHFTTRRLPGARFDNTVFSDRLTILKTEKTAVEDRLRDRGVDPGKPLIGISPSAAYGSAKEWPPERFRQLIERLLNRFGGCEVLLFGSKAEKERVSGIGERFQKRVHNLAGVFSLRDSLAAVSLCRIFISNDSGLMHVAASLGIPVIGIFGPTSPQKTAPLGREARVFSTPVHCSPCLHRVCPTDHICMKAVQVDQVYGAAEELMAAPVARGNQD